MWRGVGLAQLFDDLNINRLSPFPIKVLDMDLAVFVGKDFSLAEHEIVGLRLVWSV